MNAMTETPTEPTLRDRAIAYRERWISELSNAYRRGNEIETAEEQRAGDRATIAHQRKEIAALRALPVDAPDALVRSTVGYTGPVSL